MKPELEHSAIQKHNMSQWGQIFYEVHSLYFKQGGEYQKKVLAVGFCLGSGLFGSCNSN